MSCKSFFLHSSGYILIWTIPFLWMRMEFSSIVRQKGESQNDVSRKKAPQIFRKTNISYPLIRTRTCPYQKVRKCSFFGKFDVLCVLETPIMRLAFLSYRWRFKIYDTKSYKRLLITFCERFCISHPLFSSII